MEAGFAVVVTIFTVVGTMVPVELCEADPVLLEAECAVVVTMFTVVGTMVPVELCEADPVLLELVVILAVGYSKSSLLENMTGEDSPKLNSNKPNVRAVVII